MKNKSAKKKIIQIVCVTLCVALLVGVGGGAYAFFAWQNSDEYVRFDKNKLNEYCGGLTVLDSDGEPLCEPTFLNGRKQISLTALPDYVYMAFVAVEDKRFFKHDGVDVLRVGAAALSNLKSHGKKEGASTITQQLIKNTHLDGSKTYKRKLNEMLLARQLEQNYSKREILEMYLNTIYFGRSSYGIENAANVYFGVSASELSVAQSAILAAMIKAPNVYAPDKNAEKCLQRRNVVLKLMLQQGVIDNETYDNAMSEEIVCATYCPQTRGYTYATVVEACKLLNMTERQLTNSGLVIETYCDSAMQRVTADAVKRDKTTDKNGNFADLSVLTCGVDGGVTSCCVRGERNFAKRQPGSTLKPIAVYTPAFCDKLITQASPILDEKTNFNGYVPTNVSGYKGWTTIRKALLTSSNVSAVKTLNALTVDKAEKYLQKLGFYGKQNLSLAVGNISGGMSETDLLHCYTALADNGIAANVRFVKRIYNEHGLIYAANDNEQTQVFEKTSAYLMTDLLRQNAQCGTAKKLAKLPFQVSAKTGTVGNKQGNSDALTVAYTSRHCFLAWYSGELTNDTKGSDQPCVLLDGLLSSVYADNKPPRFRRPDGITEVTLDDNLLTTKQAYLPSNNGTKYLFTTDSLPPTIGTYNSLFDVG